MSSSVSATVDQLVLVTGGSGFLAQWCIIDLLAAGYRVRTTVRSLKREAEVRAALQTGGAQRLDSLTFVEADLLHDAAWPPAVDGCAFVLHVASPFPISQPRDENELIVPAREGTLRVLRASKAAGVRRVVITSSFAAVGYGHPPQAEPFTEETWTNAQSPSCSAYVKSKAIAERAAWDWHKAEGGAMELAVVNPVGVFGPVLSADHSTSTTIVSMMLDGGLPALPDLTFGAVDVRDCAALHLLAMTHPEAKGERFLCCADAPMLSLYDIATLLKAKRPAEASRVSTRRLPSWIVRVLALVSGEMNTMKSELGTNKSMTNAKARIKLGWTARSAEESVLATADSLVKLGVLKHSPKKS